MQAEKIKVAIASTLKPVDDTRMYEKLGMSIAESPRYEVAIIGFPTKRPATHPSIRFLPLAPFRRLSVQRAFAPWKIFHTIKHIRPDVLIVTTHELLLPAVLYKFFFRKKILYDIQENYFRNILFLPSFHFLLRPLLAVYVRSKEKLLAPFFDYFILAETGYEQELAFPGKKKIVLQNKMRRPRFLKPKKSDTDGLIHLVFTGTIADNTGVFDAINLAWKLHRHDARIRLMIIGYCALPRVLAAVKAEIRACTFIDLIGGDHLVPHDDIMRAIQQADAGIIAYKPNAATRNSLPTKLFEYLGNHLPVIMPNYRPWVRFCEPFNAAIPIDLEHPDEASILRALEKKSFYPVAPDDVYWDAEAPKLMGLLETIAPGGN